MPLIIGACLALSSTAIVIEVLSSQGRLNTSAGRASFAILLAQDLAVVPLLLFISILGTGESGSVAGTLCWRWPTPPSRSASSSSSAACCCGRCSAWSPPPA